MRHPGRPTGLGDPAGAWDQARTAWGHLRRTRLPSLFGVPGRIAVPEVCLDLLEGGDVPDVDVGPVMELATSSLARLRTEARILRVARPSLDLQAGRLLRQSGRVRAARRLWRRALVRAQRMGVPLEAARAQALWAE